MFFLSNAFSLQMLPTFPAVPVIEECDIDEITEKAAEIISVIGHADLANVLTNKLGFDVTTNRTSVKIESGDTLFVAQLVGGRLPEGATTLPENFELKFLKIRVLSGNSICKDKFGKVCNSITPCACNCDLIR